MSSLSERKSNIFKEIKEEMMTAGAGGFTGSASPEGPVAGYDPLMGKTDKVLKKHRKKKGINEETFKEKQAAARKRLAANKKAVESGNDSQSPYGKHLKNQRSSGPIAQFPSSPDDLKAQRKGYARGGVVEKDAWSTNPDTVKIQKRIEKTNEAYGRELNPETGKPLAEARDGKSAKDKDYSLHDWFKGGGWKQAGGKYDGKPCAKQPGQTTKPFCRDADDRANMSKEERDRRAAKKRREDPNPDRKGKAKNVTEEKDACYHKVKARYDVWPSAYASGALVKCRKKGAKNWGNSKKKD